MKAGGDQRVGDRFPAGADGLGVFGATTDGSLVFLDRDTAHADDERDDVRAVWEGGGGEGGAGGDHEACP